MKQTNYYSSTDTQLARLGNRSAQRRYRRQQWLTHLADHPWQTAFNIVAYLLAGVGGVFLIVLLAVKMRWTNVDGEIDQFDPNFNLANLSLSHENHQILGTATTSSEQTTSIVAQQQILTQLERKIALQEDTLCVLNLLVTQYPRNVAAILQIYQRHQSETMAAKMALALTNSLGLTDDVWDNQVLTCVDSFDANQLNEQQLLATSEQLAMSNLTNAYGWIDQEKWPVLTEAILKDQAVIQQAATLTDLPARMIVACLVGEQVRLFDSQRELFKQFFSPMKILANSNTISLGTMGMKPATAIEIEKHLQDPNSPYYLGAAYEHILDFQTNDVSNERYARLTDQNNHFYSYLYAGLYLKQMLTQWERAGYPIDHRPEIVGTLYNVGFPQSNPNSQPQVGGSKITISNGRTYSFGRLAYEFYYSGQLSEQFPL